MVKLLLDAMLKRCASFLRIFGVDALYSSAEDSELLKIAEKQNRILVTKDEELSKRASSKGIKSILVTSNRLIDRLNEILKKSGIKKHELTFPEKSRCGVDNTPLVKIDREKVKDRVPEAVYKRFNEFWECPKCKRIYWKGSHWKRIAEVYNKLE